MFLNSNLKVTQYTFTPNSNIVQGGVEVYKQGNFLHCKAQIHPAQDTLDAWTNLKIGTLSNWIGISYSVICVLNTIKPSPATLALYIDTEGNVSVGTHVAYTSGLSDNWFYGFSTQYISF